MLHFSAPILGDEIDAHYEEEIKEIIELSGTPETAFAIFSDVVKNLFEWDSQEGGKKQQKRMHSYGSAQLSSVLGN